MYNISITTYMSIKPFKKLILLKLLINTFCVYCDFLNENLYNNCMNMRCTLQFRGPIFKICGAWSIVISVIAKPGYKGYQDQCQGYELHYWCCCSKPYACRNCAKYFKWIKYYLHACIGYRCVTQVLNWIFVCRKYQINLHVNMCQNFYCVACQLYIINFTQENQGAN